MTAAAALQLALVLLPKITIGVDNFIRWIRALRAEAERTGEMTPELRAQFRAGLLAAGVQDFEQPDA